MMSRGNQLYVEELLEYGYSVRSIHKQTGLSMEQIYEIQEETIRKKALQKEMQKKED